MPPRRRQPCLTRSGAGPFERADRGWPEMPRKIDGLIESAGTAPRRVKRNWHYDVRTLEHRAAALPDQRGERPREGAAALVLDCVDDGPKRPVIRARGSGASDIRRTPSAARTSGQRQADDAPRRQRIAAAIAKRRRERQDRAPARLADGPARRVFEKLSARGTGRRQDDGEKSVRSRAKSGYQDVVQAFRPAIGRT